MFRSSKWPRVSCIVELATELALFGLPTTPASLATLLPVHPIACCRDRGPAGVPGAGCGRWHNLQRHGRLHSFVGRRVGAFVAQGYVGRRVHPRVGSAGSAFAPPPRLPPHPRPSLAAPPAPRRHPPPPPPNLRAALEASMHHYSSAAGCCLPGARITLTSLRHRPGLPAGCTPSTTPAGSRHASAGSASCSPLARPAHPRSRLPSQSPYHPAAPRRQRSRQRRQRLAQLLHLPRLHRDSHQPAAAQHRRRLLRDDEREPQGDGVEPKISGQRL